VSKGDLVKSIFLFIAASALLAAPAVFADDNTAQQLYNKALDLYKHRADSAQVAVDALTTLGQAEADVVGADLKYDILILEARTLYWQGQHTDGDDNKKVIYLKGETQAEAAIAITGEDSYAEGYYYAGINLARWAEANGIIASISHKGELIDYMNKASDPARTTRAGDDGKTVDGYGPDRVLGRMYKKLPGILGGDHNLSLKYLREAVDNAAGNSLNVVYLADTLLSGSNAEKTEGTQLLQNLVAQDPVVYGTAMDRVPETVEEFQLAKTLLAGGSIP
jgi:hypothetical protein